jgi:MerR family transcriptional regulator, copper efflux regulator
MMVKRVDRVDATRDNILNLRSYLRIKQAAGLLGVTPMTLRNWERAGKLMPRRHPINRYRLYRREELDAFLEQLQGGGPPRTAGGGKEEG